VTPGLKTTAAEKFERTRTRHNAPVGGCGRRRQRAEQSQCRSQHPRNPGNPSPTGISGWSSRARWWSGGDPNQEPPIGPASSALPDKIPSRHHAATLTEERMGEKYIFNIEHLTKHYGKKEVLKDITLYFYPGAKIGVIGSNGSGKSTLLRIMAGQDT